MVRIPKRIKINVILLILVVCICVASLLFSDAVHMINAESRIRMCENTLRAIGHAFEVYKANHEGTSSSALLELKDDIKGNYASGSDGIPHCVGNRNEDETGDSSCYIYNPFLSTDKNRPICWDSTPHHIRSRLLPDRYIWNVLYANGQVERLNKRNFFSLMRSIGISDPNNPLSENIASMRPSDIAIVFEDNYQKWKQFCKSPAAMSSTYAYTRISSLYYKNIVNIGSSAIPYIVQKSKEDRDFPWLVWAWVEIRRVYPMTYKRPNPMVNWWKGGRKQARGRFEFLYEKWKDHKVKGMSVEADEMKKSIRTLGIEALPYLIEKVKKGDAELVEVVSELTGGKVERNAFIFQCSEWWKKDKENWLIPFPNKQPVAEAGLDMAVKSGDAVELDGSASIDADKDELTYGWIQIAGPFIKLWGNTTSKLAFKAPAVKERTTLIFQLIVYDGSLIESVHPLCQSGRSKPDTIKIEVNP